VTRYPARFSSYRYKTIIGVLQKLLSTPPWSVNVVDP